MVWQFSSNVSRARLVHDDSPSFACSSGDCVLVDAVAINPFEHVEARLPGPASRCDVRSAVTGRRPGAGPDRGCR
jgi:hypothetical protein